MAYTVNSCTKETGQVVWSIKEGSFHNLVADVLDEQDAHALADKLNAVAELIEAVIAIDRLAPFVEYPERTRLRAALARVQGGAK